jgi:hypothetical protein
MNAIALQEPVSKLRRPFSDGTLPDKAFIWLPFAGGISAFAVILPKLMGTSHRVGGGYPDLSHVNGCYAEMRRIGPPDRHEEEHSRKNQKLFSKESALTAARR